MVHAAVDFQALNLFAPQMMTHVWEHNFPLFRGFLRVKWRRMATECRGPPPEDLGSTVLVQRPYNAPTSLTSVTAYAVVGHAASDHDPQLMTMGILRRCTDTP